MLQQKAMITNLTIRQWQGQKTDKKVTEQVEQANNAKNAGRYVKHIIDRSELEPLSKHTSKVRDLHYEMTLPWGDNGDRLLPSKMYLKYTDRMRALKTEREQLAKDFATKYPQLIADGAARLGAMYDPKDYPHPGDIEGRFNIELSFAPVPDANDFRVDVGNAAVEEIKQNITASVTARQKEAITDCWTRMEDVTDKIVERLDDPKKVFRDSLIENARFVADIVPDLNITDDVKLDQACRALRELTQYHPDTLRHNLVRRRAVCEQARELLRFIHANKE